LFYHKRTHYTFGPSPLVVWLKAYMLPEILGIAVPAELLALAPGTYSGFSAHAETVRQKKLDREQRIADGKTMSHGHADNGQVRCDTDNPGEDMDNPGEDLSPGDDARLIDGCEMSTSSAADGVAEETANTSRD